MIEQIIYGYMPNNKLSVELKDKFVQCAEKVKMKYILHENYDHVEDTKKLYEQVGTYWNGGPVGPGTASNFCSIIDSWKIIVETNKTSAIFEHDCFPVMNFSHFDIPDDCLVCLGPRVPSIDYYRPPRPVDKLFQVEKHAGGHGYAMTPSTAKELLQHLKEHGVQDSHDQWLFMRVKPHNITNYYDLALYAADPPPAVCVYNTDDGTVMETTRSSKDKYQPTYNFYETPGFIEGKVQND